MTKIYVLYKATREGWDSSFGTDTRYGLDVSWVESRCGVRFSTLVLTDRCAHPPSYAMVTRSFPEVKWPMRGFDRPPYVVRRSKKCKTVPSTPPRCLSCLFWCELHYTSRPSHGHIQAPTRWEMGFIAQGWSGGGLKLPRHVTHPFAYSTCDSSCACTLTCILTYGYLLWKLFMYLKISMEPIQYSRWPEYSQSWFHLFPPPINLSGIICIIFYIPSVHNNFNIVI